jgi:hypothetical protein
MKNHIILNLDFSEARLMAYVFSPLAFKPNIQRKAIVYTEMGWGTTFLKPTPITFTLSVLSTWQKQF